MENEALARPPHPQFQSTLPILLLRAREAVIERFRPVLNAHGLTEQQWRVLRTLSSGEEIEVTPLAKAVFLRGPSLSRILRDMIERGLIKRRAGETDQRFGLISITPAGLALIRSVAPEATLAADEINRRFGAERMDQLNALLLALEGVLRENGQPTAKAETN
jgi:homoprotocatechuate degradation regulator HpaR